MQNIYPKSLGSILLLFCSIMLFNLINGIPANGINLLIKTLGFSQEQAYPYALTGTVILVIIGYVMGFRALIWNRVCIGEQCEIPPNDSKR